MQLGGAERVAANISICAPAEEFEFHYLVFEGYDNVYGPEIELHGGKIITVPSPSSGYLEYIKSLFALFRENRYYAVHSHTMFNSGINLLIAKLNNIPVRIAHSHTTRTETHVSLVQKAYELIMRGLILYSSTDLYACGVEAGKWLFGSHQFYKRGHVIHNGIDTEAFMYSTENRSTIRALYGISDDELVIGHSGSLIPLKNQEFLIQLLPDILRLNPKTRLMLLGAGDKAEAQRLMSIAQKLQVTEHVIFCGGVLNVNEHLSAMDIFAFPSLREGTPLALIEAQANGLPCIISEQIPDDVMLTDLIHVVSLSKQKEWVNCILNSCRFRPQEYSAQIVQAGYSLKTSFIPLYSRYRGERLRLTSAISFSFDDARGDNTFVFDNILKQYGFPATLNVTTGYVDGTCPHDFSPSQKPAMSKADIIRLWKNSLIEVALHGDKHINTTDDADNCRKKLNAWLDAPVGIKYGFASPGSGMSLKAFRSQDFAMFRASVLYMRTSFRIRSFTALRIMSRKIGRIAHIPSLYKIAYGDTIMRWRDGKIIYSIPVMKDTTVAQLKAVIGLCIKTSGNLVLMFHSILPSTRGEDNWTWSQSNFEKLCGWLQVQVKRGKLKVLTTAQLFEQMK